MAMKVACGNGFPLNIPSEIPTGGGGGTGDYSDLTNKPKINDVTLSGEMTAADLGLASADIEDLIPSDASSTNKLATADDLPGLATTSAPGLVQPDGTTITIEDGVISAVGGSGSGDVYSTTETEIGTFLGQPLYRKCFTIASMPNATTAHIASGLTGITVRRLYGGCNNPGTFLNIPHLGSSFTYGIVCSYNSQNNEIDITTQTDDSGYNGWVCIEYTKNS